MKKFLLAGDKIMPEMHLRKPAFTYSACDPFTKNKERLPKSKETGDSRYIYQNEVDKACFQHDTAYGDFKDLTRRTTSDKILFNKAFNIDKNPKRDGYEKGLASMVHDFFDKKISATRANKFAGSGIKTENIPNQDLAEELYKPIIRKWEKNESKLTFYRQYWVANPADMQLISKFNKGFRFLLCVIDIYSKYAWVIPLKDKQSGTITNPFQKVFKESYRKPNKTWVDKDSKFYDRSMKLWLEKNATEMVVVAEGFTGTLKNKIHKIMSLISKNVHIDKLDDIVNKDNNKYHSKFKMKPVDVKSNTYINSSK